MGNTPPFKANIFHAILSNAVVLLISGLSTLVIPKFIGVEEYGYWQLFTFYGSYVLLLQLGVSAGANLRYGGLSRSDIASKDLGLQGLIVSTFTLAASVLIFCLAPYLATSTERAWVLQLVAVFAFVVNARHFVAMQMQAVSDFRSYSQTVVTDRIVFLALVITLLLGSISDFRAYAIAELLAKTASLFVAIALARDLLRVTGWRNIRSALYELTKNVYAGMQLTVASTSGLLIVGVARFFIDRVFGVAVFGSISLVLNLSNLVMAFVNAIGLVLFPVLRRTDRKNLPDTYLTIRLPLSIPPLALLAFSYPLMLAARAWLPSFGEAIQYAPVLLSIVVFEARMGLLIMPYLKALRRETLLLAINLSVLFVSTALSATGSIYFESLDLAVFAIVASLAIRATVAEILLLRILELPVHQGVWADLGLVSLSVLFNFVVGGWQAAFAYGIVFSVFILANRRQLLRQAKRLLRSLRG